MGAGRFSLAREGGSLNSATPSERKVGFLVAAYMIGRVAGPLLAPSHLRVVTIMDALAIVGLAVLLVATGGVRKLKPLARPVLFLLAFLAWSIVAAVASPYILWHPHMPLLYVVSIGGSGLLGLGAAVVVNQSHRDYAFFVSGLLMASLFIVALAAQHYDGGRLGVEGFLHPNTVGLTCGVAVLFTSTFVLKPWRIMAVVSLTVALLATMSRTSAAATMVGLSFIVWLRLDKARRVALFMIPLAFVLLVTEWRAASSAVLDIPGIGTLTGRTSLWAATLDATRDRLWFGSGPGMFSVLYDDRIREVGWQRDNIPQAHNAALHLLAEVGLVGLLLALGAVTLLIIRTVHIYRKSRFPRHSSASLGGPLLAFLLVRSVTEASFARNPTDVFLLAMAAGLVYLATRRLSQGGDEPQPFAGQNARATRRSSVTEKR